jgi:fumarate hydratase subunit beta
MKIDLAQLIANVETFKSGDRILLSGVVYTARDAAHKRLFDLKQANKPLPFNLNNAAIYYCGPSPKKPGAVIGACGPTTSRRMDSLTPFMLNEGVKVLIGKGQRSADTNKAIADNKAIYLIATGGVAALLSKTVKQAEIVAFEDLGPEAVYKLIVEDMPLTVATDCKGNSIFDNI